MAVYREYLSINRSHLYLVHVSTGERRKLTFGEEEIAVGSAKFNADGSGLWVTCDLGSEFQRLGFLDIKSGAFQPLTSDIEWNIESLWYHRTASESYLFRTRREYRDSIRSILRRVDIARSTMFPRDYLDRTVACEQPRVGSHDSIGSQYFRRIFARCRRRPDYPLDRKRNGGISGRSVAEPQVVSWKSFDEREITAFSIGLRLRSAVHGGHHQHSRWPEGQSRPGFLGRSNFFLNELGVAILYPNVRGSDGFGKTFLKLDNGLKRLDSVRDIGALLDWIAKQPDLDPQRIMVTGGSYGGYMTLACAVEYNDRIRCSLDVVGISHFGTFLRNTESYRRDLRRAEYGDERLRKSPSSLIAWPR